MRIQLSDHFTYNKLIRFTMPNIFMMILLQIYWCIDGFFLSNFAGKTSLAAVNLVVPLWIILASLGFVFAAGGTAYVSKTLGEGNREGANKFFSLFIYANIVYGIITAIIAYFVAEPFAKFLGAEGKLLEESVLYIRIVSLVEPFFMLQTLFQQFFTTAEKPKLALYVTIAAGILNIILDAIFVWYLKWGILGAALATNICVFLSGVIPFLYFCLPNNSLLRLCRCNIDFKALKRAFLNGISEFVNSISGSVVSFLYNYQLMKYMGEDGVAAYGVMMFAYCLFQAVFTGYAVGNAPLFGFNYGARNAKELKNLLFKSLTLILIASIVLFCMGEIFAPTIAHVYVGYDKDLYNIAIHILRICSICFLFFGFHIFASDFFTALSDGVTSAKIAFLRSFVFEPAFIMLFPIYFEKDSIWWAVVIADIVCVFISAYYFIKKRDLYLHPNPDY